MWYVVYIVNNCSVNVSFVTFLWHLDEIWKDKVHVFAEKHLNLKKKIFILVFEKEKKLETVIFFKTF